MVNFVHKKLTQAARLGVKLVSAGADLVFHPGTGVVILIYHQVGAPGDGAVNLSLNAFEAQMSFLSAECSVVSLDRGLDLLRLAPGDGEPITAERIPVVVTFDDGTADFVDHALPILVRHQIPVTLYLATKWVEEGRSFWDDGTVLSWSGVREAHSTGLVTVGSHSHSHALLDRRGAAEVADDLDRSIGLIADNLGHLPRHFAYPKALAPSGAAGAEVRARFDSAALAGTRPNPFGATDPFSLARTPIQVADGDLWFRRKARGGLGLEDRLRARLLSRRYSAASR